MINNKNEITYEMFDIDPEEFYARKFHVSEHINITDIAPIIRKTINFQKTEILLDHIQRCLAGRSGRLSILDLGCGSGIFGAWVRESFSDSNLVGIDMSRLCVESARNNGYDEVISYNFAKGLPFGDERFDLVFTMDVFGHIEFRNKDHLVEEIARVTKSGGKGLHGIETGHVDYFNCNPHDDRDCVRRYVYTDGHIGVESLEDNVERFQHHFVVTEAYPWLIHPFLPISNVIDHCEWGESLATYLRPFDEGNARLFADVVTYQYNKYMLHQIKKAVGPVQTRDLIEAAKFAGPLREIVVDLLKGCGFSFIALSKPEERS